MGKSHDFLKRIVLISVILVVLNIVIYTNHHVFAATAKAVPVPDHNYQRRLAEKALEGQTVEEVRGALLELSHQSYVFDDITEEIPTVIGEWYERTPGQQGLRDLAVRVLSKGESPVHNGLQWSLLRLIQNSDHYVVIISAIEALDKQSFIYEDVAIALINEFNDSFALSNPMGWALLDDLKTLLERAKPNPSYRVQERLIEILKEEVRSPNVAVRLLLVFRDQRGIFDSLRNAFSDSTSQLRRRQDIFRNKKIYYEIRALNYLIESLPEASCESRLILENRSLVPPLQ